MHASLQYLTPVLPCVLSPVVLLSVSPLFPSCALSLCLQEEGVVSFCKVCALGLVNSPSHHLPNDMSKHDPHPPPKHTHVLPTTPHAPVLLTPYPLPLPKPPPAACATEHTESELPIMPLGGPLLTIAGTLGIVAQPTQSHFYF